MAELKGNNEKKRLAINLSFFAPTNDHNNNCSTKSSSTANKPPKNFEEPDGVVGLGIVAAMNELDPTHQHHPYHDPFFSAINKSTRRAAILAVSPRSNPIPTLTNNNKNTSGCSAKFIGGGGGGGEPPNLSGDEMELSEEYTCVISHIGNNLIKKREYFDDADCVNGNGGSEKNTITAATSYWVSSGVFTASSLPPTSHGGDAVAVFRTADFLSSCYLCKKKLHGLDIFMYRGEKAFCSSECRSKQISIDEHKEKCGSGMRKPLEYSSVSPCSSPMQFFAGVAAA